MKKPKLRELKEALRALCKGPYTSKFPFQPHQPPDAFRGRPEFHEEDCVGCGACVQVCPAKAIEMQDKGNKRILTINWDLCIFCGQCQANCLTTKGIILSDKFDLATTNRKELKHSIEKEVVFCSCCAEPIAVRQHILWVAEKLGPLLFSNASLMLFYLENLNLAIKEEDTLKEKKDFVRADRLKVLCPRCRREAVLKS